MIEQFQNIQDLIFKIKTEKSTNNITQNRFPVRFIFLSNFESLQNLVFEFKKWIENWTDKISNNQIKILEAIHNNSEITFAKLNQEIKLGKTTIKHVD